jgi:hypothetical protein
MIWSTRDRRSYLLAAMTERLLVFQSFSQILWGSFDEQTEPASHGPTVRVSYPTLTPILEDSPPAGSRRDFFDCDS